MPSRISGGIPARLCGGDGGDAAPKLQPPKLFSGFCHPLPSKVAKAKPQKVPLAFAWSLA